LKKMDSWFCFSSHLLETQTLFWKGSRDISSACLRTIDNNHSLIDNSSYFSQRRKLLHVSVLRPMWDNSPKDTMTTFLQSSTHHGFVVGSMWSFPIVLSWTCWCSRRSLMCWTLDVFLLTLLFLKLFYSLKA
jgi:hypothetical protein